MKELRQFFPVDENSTDLNYIAPKKKTQSFTRLGDKASPMNQALKYSYICFIWTEVDYFHDRHQKVHQFY